MDRRTILAIVLILMVAVLPSLLFRPSALVPAADVLVGGSADSGAPVNVTPSAPAVRAPVSSLRETADPVTRRSADQDSSAEQIVVVESPLYRFSFSTHGARLVGAVLKHYRSFAPGDSGPANVVPAESQFLDYRVVFGVDTVKLSDWTFAPSAERVDVGPGGAELTWTARRAGAVVTLQYRFADSDYLFDVHGDLNVGGSQSGLVLVGMGPHLRMVESDSVDDRRSYSLVTKARSTERVDFSALDPGERQELPGPFEWVAFKTKYFVAAVLALDSGASQFGGVAAVGGPRYGKQASNASAFASLPAPNGVFSHSVYIGPQEYRRLAGIGHNLNDVNPYGWILRPVIQPFSVLIVRILLWMHEGLHLAYGWVLVLFGIAVRVVLWPLNQKAMRSSMAMQALQPEMKALQDRYKTEPQKMQQEIMKLYKDHNVSPLGGCLPMLIPMPVLFALFFVFANTIEFRGVPFLWLPDLSRADPLYVIPLLMGISMYGLSKIGQMGMPPNPQATMMLYIMPVMFTVLFLQFSSGLNLYYAVSNIASIPQQWLISRERLRRQKKPAAVT
ncbi:MAG: membrane protein insertase YidC [Gemmatimonadetes bacterium]|nr:membrane protein insertase YidC [Gemmatimonadota bacterium]